MSTSSSSSDGRARSQGDFERILAEWVLEEIGVPILRGCEVLGQAQDGGGVDVQLSGDRALRAEYLDRKSVV